MSEVTPTVEYLVVAGGGGAAVPTAGGGAGGYRTAAGYVIQLGAEITVTVGAGGSGHVPDGIPGGNSVFGTITSLGGGGGNDSGAGGAGGSGGGGVTGGAGTPGQGHDGSTYAGGGSLTAASGATPGSGTVSSISGTAVTYASGGDPSSFGASMPGDGGGSGGSAQDGIVMIRYPDSFLPANATTGEPDYVLAGGYHSYRWWAGAVGSITFGAPAFWTNLHETTEAV